MAAKLIAAGMTEDDAHFYAAEYPDDLEGLLGWVADGTYHHGDLEAADDVAADEALGV